MLRRLIRNIICYKKLSFYRVNYHIFKKTYLYKSSISALYLCHSESTHLESISVIVKSIARCRAQVGVVEEAAEKELREAKFEGVMWHGGYDQSITSSAAQAPHTAPILPGPLPFVRYTSAAAEKTEREKVRRPGEWREVA